MKSPLSGPSVFHKALWWLLPLTGMLLMFYWSHANTTDVPKWDAYPIIGEPLVKMLAGELTVADLHDQAVDNRMMIPRLVHLAVARLTKWSIPAETAMTVALGGLTVLMLVGLVRRTWPQGGWRPWLVALIAGCCWFSLSGFQIWTYGPFLGHSLVACLTVAQVWVFTLNLRVRWKLLWGCLLGIGASNSYIYGWLSWGVLAWLLLGLRNSQVLRRREFYTALALVGMVIGLTGITYFRHYEFAGKPGLAKMILNDPMRYLNFFLQWLGSGIGNPWPTLAKPARLAAQYSLAWWAGAVLSAGLLLATVRIWKDRSLRNTVWPWCGLAGWGLVGGMFVTVGRADFSTEAAFWPRYQLLVYSVYLFLLVVFLLATPFRSRWRWLGLAPMTVVLIGWINGSITGYQSMRGDYFSSQAVHGALIMKDVAPDPVLLNQLFPGNYPCVQQVTAALVPQGYMRPGVLSHESVKAATIQPSSDYAGLLAGGEIKPDGSLNLNGWAVNLRKKCPADAVVISLQPEGGEEIWWTVAPFRRTASKPASKHKLTTANARIGWELGASETFPNLARKPLPAGKLTFRAYALDVKTLTFHPLEGTFLKEQ